MRDLGTLGGDQSWAYGINESGQVTGLSDYGGFITGPDGMGMRVLEGLGGDFSYPTDINDTGQVAGRSSTAEGLQHAFITGPDGMGIRDLGTLGGNRSWAYGINDVGQVVGWSNTAEGPGRAFITGANGMGMMDLNSLVDLPEGVILIAATDINNNGQVIAVGIVPEPETYALMLAGLGLIGFSARCKKANSIRVNFRR